jgi:hypothetical protein
MSALFRQTPPWYAAGLAFECIGCGRCCAGPEEGYVWATAGEIAAIAAYLKMPVRDFRRKYVRREGRRHSLVEDPLSRDCVFLDDGCDRDGQPCRLCRVYPVRPLQCRTWPFWRQNLSSPQAWIAAQMRCPGINRGRMYTAEQIRRRLEGRLDGDGDG